MIKNYIKIAWRNLLKNKQYTAINIGGLAVGMAFAMIIGLWIQYETSFDSFHKNRDRIALLMKNVAFNNQKSTQDATPFPLNNVLKTEYPEVKRASKVSWPFSRSLTIGDKKIKRAGRYVDPDFLEMFSFQLLEGDAKTVLNDPNSIILTESLANALFGTADPMGKTLTIDDQYEVRVTGILSDVPANATLQFDFLGPYAFEVQNNAFIKDNTANWENNFLMNMVELHEGISMADFTAKISRLNMERDNTIKDQYLFLHPLKKWHLYGDFRNWVNTGGKITYIKLFGIAGIFVLLIACVNFMNLSTARSQKRAKEVGIRKVLGSRRNQLIAQFFSESLLTTVFAFILSIGLILLLQPWLKDMGLANITFEFRNGLLLTLGFAVCVVTGLVAGSYPAFYLSSFLPVRTLKGIFKPGKSPITLRRTLVVFQFTISISLIIGTAVVFRQLAYAKDRPIGYDPNNLIAVPFSNDLITNFNALKAELLGSPYIDAVAKASSPITAVYNQWSDFSWDGKDPNAQIALDVIMTEWDFEKAANLEFVIGRPFSTEFANDSNGVILNESAFKVTGYKDPIGRTMKLGDRELNIVGVVKDMVMRDPFKPAVPGVILFDANAATTLFVRLKPDADLKKALAAIGPVFEKHNAEMPFEYSFVDDDFNEKFALENQTSKLGGLFSVLAIFISCLGLFGLASFTAEQRIKEIGIRKVLGASISNLWQLLSKDFVILVMIACIIASPIAYYLMENWLQQYEYRTTIGWPVFIAAGATALLITILTISFQAVKAAVANPVDSLRDE